MDVAKVLPRWSISCGSELATFAQSDIRLTTVRSPAQSGGHALGWWRDGLHGARVERRAARWRPVRREHACDERSGSRGAGGYEPGPSVAPELLTSPLIGRPCVAARSGVLEGDASQLLDVAEVGKLKVKAPAMMVVGNVILGRESPLGKRAIPLCCCCRDGVGEIQRGDDLTSLPASVRWCGRSPEQGGLVRYVPDPRALDGARTNGQLLHGQETPGYSISAISLATLRYSPRAMSSIGFSSSNARIGRCSQTGIASGRRTRPSRLIISASSISRSARVPVGSLRPESQPRTVLGFAPVAAAIIRSDRPAVS